MNRIERLKVERARDLEGEALTRPLCYLTGAALLPTGLLADGPRCQPTYKRSVIGLMILVAEEYPVQAMTLLLFTHPMFRCRWHCIFKPRSAECNGDYLLRFDIGEISRR